MKKIFIGFSVKVVKKSCLVRDQKRKSFPSAPIVFVGVKSIRFDNSELISVFYPFLTSYWKRSKIEDCCW